MLLRQFILPLIRSLETRTALTRRDSWRHDRSETAPTGTDCEHARSNLFHAKTSRSLRSTNNVFRQCWPAWQAPVADYHAHALYCRASASIAASVRGYDYDHRSSTPGRTNTLPGKMSSASRCRHALRGINSTTQTNPFKDAGECQCQNMPMRMHGNQSRNLQSPSDPRDRGC
eukprot:1434433-Pleurochrysis_carterae.AAC.2